MRHLAAGVAGAALLVAAGAGAEIAPDEVVIENIAIEESLTGTPGDPEKGREYFAARKLGNCLACHANSDMSELPFHGEVGPPVDGAGDRWEAAQLRAIVVNSKKVFGDQTIMPAFYRTGGLNRVRGQFEGETILTAQQVEDVVAYLMTLKAE
jgi:sulfur-oxidizing protein SoxX